MIIDFFAGALGAGAIEIPEPLIPDAASMHFSIGWIITFAVILLVNLISPFHYIRAQFKHHLRAVHIGLVVFHFALAVPFVIYFVNFFAGHSKEPYMATLMYFAGFYLVYMFYAGTLYLFWDIGRFALRLFSKKRKREPKFRKYSVLITSIILAFSVAAAGTSLIFPHHISITDYDVTLDKRDSTLSSMKAVFISDSHIGSAVRAREIDEIVSDTMALNPDIILFGGDIFDEGTSDYLKEYTSKAFSKLSAKYGVYFILGNHDDYTGDTEAVLSYFEKAGIEVLLNDTILIDDEFYLIGREDHPSRRNDLPDLEKSITKDLPVILLDHKPLVRELKKSDLVELQISGHTHDGQIYPASWVTPTFISLNYGLHKYGDTQIIVSSGVGGYAVPVRLGSPAEIVEIGITFQ
ncbi:MAG: metallophosphoesterase [Clostridiales Family XIII bacterium]|jgi:predicted MPP superfamily phosphohydrolase|nr:metallophosphoesterase [Clostridiales Family XIII bacterium]